MQAYVLRTQILHRLCWNFQHLASVRNALAQCKTFFTRKDTLCRWTLNDSRSTWMKTTKLYWIQEDKIAQRHGFVQRSCGLGGPWAMMYPLVVITHVLLLCARFCINSQLVPQLWHRSSWTSYWMLLELRNWLMPWSQSFRRSLISQWFQMVHRS